MALEIVNVGPVITAPTTHTLKRCEVDRTVVGTLQRDEGDAYHSQTINSVNILFRTL